MKRIYLIAVSVILVATGISASQWNQQSPSASQTHRQSSIPTSTEALSPSMLLVAYLTPSTTPDSPAPKNVTIVPVPPSPTITPSATPPAPPTTTPATVPATPAPPASPTPHVSSPPTSAPVAGGNGAWTMAAATKVADCESGGWGRGAGGNFVGDMGITRANWDSLGGTSDTSPEAQIVVAEKIQSYPPDQNGCQPGGW